MDFFYISVSAFSAFAVSQNSLSLPDGAELLVGDIRSTFSCPDRYGYFADIDTDCRVFHVCNPVAHPNGLSEMQHFSFVCGNQTIFDQLSLSCAYPEDAIPCKTARSFFYLNERVGQEEVDIHNENDIAQAAPHVPRYLGKWGAPVNGRRPTAVTALATPQPSAVRNKVARHVDRLTKAKPKNNSHEVFLAPNSVSPIHKKPTFHKNKLTQVAQTFKVDGTPQGSTSPLPVQNAVLTLPTPRPISHPPKHRVAPPPQLAPIFIKETPIRNTVAADQHPAVVITVPPPNSTSDLQSTFFVNTLRATRRAPQELLRTSLAPPSTEAPDSPATFRFGITTADSPTTTTNRFFQTTRNSRINVSGATGSTVTETLDVTGSSDNFTPTADTVGSVTKSDSGATLFMRDNTSRDKTDSSTFVGTSTEATDSSRPQTTPLASTTESKSDALQTILSVGPRAEGATKPAGRRLRRKRVKTLSTETTPATN